MVGGVVSSRASSGPTAVTLTRPLAGVSVVVTADRRYPEIAAAFERRGAHVEHAPALIVVQQSSDSALVECTRRVIDHRPDIIVVTTGIGFRGWIEAADAAGLGESLLDVMAGARLIARGPKARGAIEAAGLRAHWVAASETAGELRDYLLGQGVSGAHIVVQHHGSGADGLDDAFRDSGATVVPVVVYGWRSADAGVLTASLTKVADGGVDVVVFTSAPGVCAWLGAARPDDLTQIRRRNRGGDLVLAAVGPVTAAPLLEAGLLPLVPDRWRLGALIREVVTHVSARPPVATTRGPLTVHARAAVLGGRTIPLSSAGAAVLRLLSLVSGAVVTRDQFLAELPAGTEAHSVDVTVARLRVALGAKDIIRTVVKRGYALAVEDLPAAAHEPLVGISR